MRLHTAARVGAETSELAGQLAGLPPGYRADVAVIVVGGNDVTHRVPVAESVRHLTDAVELLGERGAPVVVGTCPDLGALRAVPQPLRTLGSRASRQLAAAQRDAALRPVPARCRWRAWSGRSSSPTPTRCSAWTGSTRAPRLQADGVKAMLPSVLAALGYAETVPFGHHAPARSPGPRSGPGSQPGGSAVS